MGSMQYPAFTDFYTHNLEYQDVPAKKTVKKKVAKKPAPKRQAKTVKKKKAAAPRLAPGSLLSPSAVAERHQVSTKTVHKALVEGRLKHVSIHDATGQVVARGVTATDCKGWSPAYSKEWRKNISDGQKVRYKKPVTKKKSAPKKKPTAKATTVGAAKAASKAASAVVRAARDLTKKRAADRAYRAKKRAAAKKSA